MSVKGNNRSIDTSVRSSQDKSSYDYMSEARDFQAIIGNLKTLLSKGKSPPPAAKQTEVIVPAPQSHQDDVALKKKLQREDLRKREFDRKLEREVIAIESVLTHKYQKRMSA